MSERQPQTLNKVILEGRLTRDPKLGTDKNGKPYAFYDIATNTDLKADFHKAASFNPDHVTVIESAKKGDPITMSGELKYRDRKTEDGKPYKEAYIRTTEVTVFARTPRGE